MKIVRFVALWTFIVLAPTSIAYNYHWEISEKIQGADRATQVDPVKVIFLDEPIQVASHSASLRLMEKYSVYLGTEWSPGRAYQLLQTFESIPQPANNFYEAATTLPYSLWKLTQSHIQDDITVNIERGQKIVTISEAAFTYADARLAEIEGVRGRFFSRRLHHAVVWFVTDSGRDRFALEDILNERYGVSLNVPDYSALTQSTTGEHAGRFTTFKNEEVMALVTMLEEFPQGMHKIEGLKYLIRRLDGTPHPLYPSAPAVAWTGTGYIEFMESAFQEQGTDYIHRLILHEKAHFLWAHLFDEQLRQDWIQLGGWYENPDDANGWSTTKQTEFVSAYAHGVNPSEDMAESISFYIVNPDKLRSRSPAKYQFIQDRIMHGTRYISRIREDLTFEVYNLYPDVLYPGRIIRVDIQVNGEPETDKEIVIELEIHRTGDFGTAQASRVRIFSPQGTFFDLWLNPIGPTGKRSVDASHILRGQTTLSRYAAAGYWGPDAITLRDAQGNERHQSQTDFGWKLYLDNPLADNEAPVYVRNSMRLSLSEGMENGRSLQILTARWQIFEENQVKRVYAQFNDGNSETYSRRAEDWGKYNPQTGQATVELKIPDYYQSGAYELNYIRMEDVGLNARGVYFTDPGHALRDEQEILDEEPATIEIKTTHPDSTPPVLDLNRIAVKAEPTKPGAPDGETTVDITFRIKDDISGYSKTDMYLRDPHGVMHLFRHYHSEFHNPYFSGDPTVYQTYHKTIILPVGSIPGTWGIAEMTALDKARNPLRVDFTEIVRFEIGTPPQHSRYDVNQDGLINIYDLVLVASEMSNYLATPNQQHRADVNSDGDIDILDLILVANQFSEPVSTAPAVNNPITEHLQNWLIEAIQADDGSPIFRQGIDVLEALLRADLPKQTVLLPNYPNPFNPETWIPYELSEAAHVVIIIYNSVGQVVQTLDLGHQVAGVYRSKSRAVYWNGLNRLGEQAASDIYYYLFSANAFRATGKMLLLK